MKYRRYTGQEIIEKTREAIHLFAGKQVDAFLHCLDPDFSWVADTEGIFLRGADAFAENVRTESGLPPVRIVREEYAVAARDRRLWVVYGRFSAESAGQAATVHFTFAWVQRQEGLFLIHANASHARSAPVLGEGAFAAPAGQASPAKGTSSAGAPSSAGGASPAGKAAQARMFLDAPEDKLRFRDMEGRIHFLFPREILYFRSRDPLCEVHTVRETFQTRAALRGLVLPGFFLIHRSYLVNTAYLRTLRRFRAALPDGTELPVSRERYMALKRFLQKEQAAGHGGRGGDPERA